MSKKLIFLCIFGSFGSFLGMDTPVKAQSPVTRSAKRKLFEMEIRDKENLSTPTKKVVNEIDIPATRLNTPATPENVRRVAAAKGGMYTLAVQNMSKKPVMVTYYAAKGPTYRMLTADRVDFPNSRIDAQISLRHAPLTIAPTGEHFIRLVLDKSKSDKFIIEKFVETAHGNGFIPIGDTSIDPTKPLLVQLHTRLNDKGFEHTDIDILNK